jgi:hypothetical protein
MALLRADRSLFDSEETLNYLVRFTGGSPRDLLRLLLLAYAKAKAGQFDRAAIEAAVCDLATDYRRVLEDDDYRILYEIDTGIRSDANSERIRYLLRHTALLEYNNYWRRSHPAVRLLEGYKRLETRMGAGVV